MTIHTISSREFTRDIAAAKRAANDGPVFITHRGQPAYALLKIDDYYGMTGQHRDVSLLALMDNIACEEGIEFEPAKLSIQLSDAQLG